MNRSDQVQAFDTRTIVETRRGSLRSNAIIPPIRVLTEMGVVFVYEADAIRYSDENSIAEVQISAGYWVRVTDLGIVDWAYAERLHWRKPDGEIVRWDYIVCEDCWGTGNILNRGIKVPGSICDRCAGKGKLQLHG